MHSAKFSSALEAPKFSDAGSAVQAHEARPAHTPYSPRRTSAQIAVLRGLVENAPNARKICGSQMIALCEELRSELGRPVRILDLGCGAVSSLAYLHHAGLADVVGVDADADAHATELAALGLTSPVRQIIGSGETLGDLFRPGSFDVVHARETLETSKVPGLVMLNIFDVLPVRGTFVHAHAICGATQRQHVAPFGYDLTPDDDGHLVATDSDGVQIGLTADLPLSVIEHQAYECLETFGWFRTSYRKTSHEIAGTAVYQQIQLQLLLELRRPGADALTLEPFVSRLLDRANDRTAATKVRRRTGH